MNVPAGVRYGRTSARLRNPDNAPPRWARAYLEATDGKKAAAVSPIAFDLGDRVLLSFSSCDGCAACMEGRPAYCVGFVQRNLMFSTRNDGSPTVYGPDGPIAAVSDSVNAVRSWDVCVVS